MRKVHNVSRSSSQLSLVSAGEHLRRLGGSEHFETTPKELAKSKRKVEDWTDDMMSIFVVIMVGIIVVIAMVAMMAIVAVRAMSALM